MGTVHGFQLLREEEIAEIKSTARLYQHLQSGARLLSLINEDENKVFGISFRTPPETSNGIAHIMEHSVLCGSRKYRLKEPFIELVKGSLNTFLNAITFPDKTCYPLASANLQDFYNLIDVYLDAVLHPLIPEHTLQQEGWHYELDSLEDDLTYKGVVFNEMKGAYSSPDGLISRYARESLFPASHPYGVDSGGDPTVIPDLTYAEFKAFHERYYHPANSYIFFYGDDDPQERLRLLDGYLSEFEAIDPTDTALPAQPLIDQPQQFDYPYAVDQEQGAATEYILLNWLLPEIDQPETRLGLSILSHALLGTVGSPLRKKLIDSGLGEDVLGNGFATQLRQPLFSVGLKGVAAENRAKVEQLIIDTLQELATKGIDSDTIEASINTIEFNLRESNTGSFPRGLAHMLGVLGTWVHEGDPLEGLRYERPLQTLKAQAAQGERYFEALLGRYLLENDHRTTVTLQPDADHAQRLEREEKAKLHEVRAQMSTAELQAVLDNAQALRQMQDAPDDPAELAKLPMLTLADLEQTISTIPIEVTRQREVEIVYHDLFTNGIVYLSVGLNLRVLPADLLPYVPLFSYALTEMGTETEDFVQLSQRIGRTTGGIRPSRLVLPHKDKPEAVAWLTLQGKATMENAPHLLDILRDVLLTVKLDNRERFQQMVMEEKAGQEARLIPMGHQVVIGRLRAQFNESGWINEQIGGVDYLFFMRQLAQQVETDWPSVLEKLETIRRLLVNRANMLCDITLDSHNWATFQPQLDHFLEALPRHPVHTQQWSRQPLPVYEGLTIPAPVNYVGKAANLYDLGYAYHASAQVITNYLRTSYLWENIRMQGGAYGAFCLFDTYTGLFMQASYRDPNLLPTLAVYDGVAAYLQQRDLPRDEIVKSIIGTIGQLDTYRLPDAKGKLSLDRYLLGITDVYRQQKRLEVLETTAAHFQQLGEVLRPFKTQGAVAVLGAAEALHQANEALAGQKFTITKVM